MRDSLSLSRDIFGVQLSHLRVFLAVYEEHSVRRAATRLGLTPSAISHSLTKMRAIVGDDLFLRRPDGMAATARADEIAQDLSRTLDHLHSLLSPSRFDPAESVRHFTISCLPYMSALLGPALAHMLEAHAPSVTIEIRNLEEGVFDQLERGRIDFAIAPADRPPPTLRSVPLTSERLAIAIRKGHPRGEGPLILDELGRLRHIDIRMGAYKASTSPLAKEGAAALPLRPQDSTLAEQLAAKGLPHRIAMTVPDLATALAIVADTDLVALCVRRAAEEYARAHAVDLMDIPYPASLQSSHLLWNARHDRDSAHVWLREWISAHFPR